MSTIQTVILSSGKGERMLPLSADQPKGLLPIAGIPILQRILFLLAEAGLMDVILQVQPQWIIPVKKRLFPALPQGMKLEIEAPTEEPWSHSAGSLMSIRDRLPKSFLVIYGDSLLKANLNDLIGAHRTFEKKGALATILYHRPPDLLFPEVEDRTYHGVMALDSSDQVIRFEEKPRIKDIQKGFNLANAAVFVVEKKLFDLAPQKNGPVDFSKDLFQPLANSDQGILFGWDIGSGFRRDIGSLSRYVSVYKEILHEEISIQINGTFVKEKNSWFGDDVRIHPSCNICGKVIIGNGCRLAKGVMLEGDVILGDDVILEQGVLISNSILLDNVCVKRNAQIKDSIVGFGCIVGKKFRLPPKSVLGSHSAVCVENWPIWRSTA